MKAYIFDLDGTLLDSMDVWEKIDVEFLLKRGIAAPPDYQNAISSMTFDETARYTIERFGLSSGVESLKREWNGMAAYAYGHTVKMKRYAKEYLAALVERGAKLALATSLSAELRGPVLRNNGVFDWFHAICGTDETGHGKTRPDVFLLAAEKLKTPPRDCIVFEDILAAVKSAKSAGFAVCAVYDKASENDWEEIKKTADWAIHNWKDAPLY